MGIPVLIMGRSGAGKSASLRNVVSPFLLINVINKPLPFKKNENILEFCSDDYKKIMNTLTLAPEKGYKSIVIDDAGYLMTNRFMAGHRQAKGNAQFEMYNEIGDDFYSLLRYVVKELPSDEIVYMFMHEEINDLGYSKPKTIGRLLDEKVCIEGLFTIVLHAMKLDNKYVFATSTDGLDVTKTPIGMFQDTYIENDLQLVDETIREYYK